MIHQVSPTLRRASSKMWISAAVALFVLTFLGTYYAAIRSDANKAAEKYLRSSPEISERVGIIKAVNLKPYAYRLRVTLSGGRASFLYAIDGEDRSADAKVLLRKDEGIWRVIQLEVDGTRYDLE